MCHDSQTKHAMPPTTNDACEFMLLCNLSSSFVLASHFNMCVILFRSSGTIHRQPRRQPAEPNAGDPWLSDLKRPRRPRPLAILCILQDIQLYTCHLRRLGQHPWTEILCSGLLVCVPFLKQPMWILCIQSYHGRDIVFFLLFAFFILHKELP